MDPRLDEIAHLLEHRADGAYGLHDVTQKQHALQAALAAEQAGCAASLVAAALLHDIGHMVHDLGENPAAAGVDDQHEALGHAYLAQWFGADVTEPVRLHVAAKRYLCTMEPGYFARLAPDSVLSLSLQGGPMSAEECRAFQAGGFAQAAVTLRRFDEAAKDPDLATPPVAHFMAAVAACIRPAG